MRARTPGADVAVLLQSLLAQAGDVVQSKHSVGKSFLVGSGAPALDKVVRNRDDREKSILHMTNWVCVPKAMQTNSAKHVQSRKSNGKPGSVVGRQRAGKGTILSIGRSGGTKWSRERND